MINANHSTQDLTPSELERLVPARIMITVVFIASIAAL